MGTDAKLSFYNSAKDVAPSRNVTARELVRIIHDGDHAEAVARVRAATTEDEKRAAKMKIPAVQISGHVTEGRRGKALEEGRFEHSGWLQLDLDADDLNSTSPQEARAILGADPHVLSAFLSPSGEGAKALFRIKPCRSDAEHKAEFLAVEKHIFKTYGFKIDPATKDAGRLCYLSDDAECTWNGAPVEFVAPVEIAELTRIKSAGPLVIREKAFPEPPQKGIHSWLMEAAWHCRLHEGMGEADTVTKLKSYDGSLRRPLQDTEATDAARTVFSQPLDAPQLQGKPRIDPETLRQKAYASRFDPQVVPPPDETCMLIGDVPIAARGNLSVIQGKSKVGKSAVVAAILGAAQRGNFYSPADALCISWEGESKGAIIHLDTEQSPSDWHSLVCRSVTRSGLSEVSSRLVSLQLVKFARSERLEILRQTLIHEMAAQGAIDAVIIDGIADLCLSPNDEGEALELVSQVMAMSHEFDTPMFCVLHENPGTEQAKTRGHLGSELNRKAFANLRIDKDDKGVSTIYGTDMRKRDIPKEQGFCFAWDDVVKMHTFRGRAGGMKAAQKQADAIEKARSEWEPIFEEIGTNSTCPDLTPEEAAVIERDINETKKLTTTDAMKKRMQRAEALGVLRKTKPGSWALNPSGQSGQMRDK